MFWLVLAGCFSTPTLDDERAALREAEARRIDALARDARAAGDVGTWADALSSGPESSWSPLLDVLETTPPKDAARAYAKLYERATSPSMRNDLRRRTEDALARDRYLTEASREITAKEQAGVTATMGKAAVRRLRAEYVDPLEDRPLLEAGARRLDVLLGSAPTLGDAAFETEFDGLVAFGVERGMSRQAAVAEIVEAMFADADPWSAPVWPAQIAAWQRHHDGVQQGVVGLVVDDVDGHVVVRGLVEGGPALEAGVHQGDRILEVRHASGTVDLRESGTATDAARAMRGPDGVAVTLLVERDGSERAFTVARRSVAERTVFGWRRHADGFSTEVEPGIHFVRIAAFRPGTLQAFDGLLSTPPEALVLDLRGNGGGDLEAAVQIADRFIAEGRMLTLEGRLTGKPAVDKALLDKRDQGTHAHSGDPLESVRIAILVDGGTASSAEILTGALAHHRDAAIIGSRTTGKGSSQVLRVDEVHGFGLQFTNLYWRLPDGRRIHREDAPDAAPWGIEPTHSVALTPLEQFAAGVLQAKREALVEHPDGSAMRYAGPEMDPSLPMLSADPQIQRALEVLRAPR